MSIKNSFIQSVTTFFSDLWFIKKQIIVSIVAMLSILAIILYVTMYSLEVYTNHGESIEVPDLISLRVEDAEKLLEIRDLMIIVNDSICKGNGLGGIIKDQTPKAGSRVKEKRKIYLTVTRTTDCSASIYYNQIIGRPLEFVKRQLQRNQLRLGSITYVPGGKAENTVTKAFVKGVPIFIEADFSKGDKPPTAPQKVPHGSLVDLVLLEGIDATAKRIPRLVCNRVDEAEFILMGSQFIRGTIHCNQVINDTMSAWIWKQSPTPGEESTQGTGIDIWIMSDEPTGCLDTSDIDLIQPIDSL